VVAAGTSTSASTSTAVQVRTSAGDLLLLDMLKNVLVVWCSVLRCSSCSNKYG
jgi:hypothetical protein